MSAGTRRDRIPGFCRSQKPIPESEEFSLGSYLIQVGAECASREPVTVKKELRAGLGDGKRKAEGPIGKARGESVCSSKQPALGDVWGSQEQRGWVGLGGERKAEGPICKARGESVCRSKQSVLEDLWGANEQGEEVTREDRGAVSVKGRSVEELMSAFGKE